VDLIVDHVLQTLVVCWTNEYLRRHLATGVSIVKHLCQTVTGNLRYTGYKIFITMQPFKVEMIQDNYTTSQNIKQPQAISSKVV